MSTLDDQLNRLAEPLNERGGWLLGEWTGPGGVVWIADAVPMIYNMRLIVGRVDEPWHWAYGWCYRKDPLVVLTAYRVWLPDTEDEPMGWHKRATTAARARRAPNREKDAPVRCEHGTWPGEACQPGCRR